jgi:hypothetical protein
VRSLLRNLVRAFLTVVAGGLLVWHSLQAYEVPLKPVSINEAYVLGRRNDTATAEFMNPYIKQLTAGTEHPDITQIEILTPFAQMVDLSRRNATNQYTEEHAGDDYRRRGDKIIVQITLILPAAYAKAKKTLSPESPLPTQNKESSLAPENFWQNFRFNLKQNGKVVPTRSVHNQPIYSTATKNTPAVLDGATVQLEYDAKDVGSDLATVEVLTPESKTVSTSFDLQKLR